MKRNFNVVVRNSDGHPHVREIFKYDEKSGMPVTANGAPVFDRYEAMTLRQYAIEALGGRWRGEDTMSNVDLWKRMKLHDQFVFSIDGVVELSNEDATLVLDALNRQGRPPLVVGRMKDLIDNDPTTEGGAHAEK